MKFFPFLFTTVLLAQPSYNLITIVPVTDGTTGAKTTPGRIVFQDKQTPTHLFGFTAADSIGADIIYKLWNTDQAGCIVSSGTTNGDGTKNLTIDPTCTGTSITSPWSVDANNNVYLNVGGDTIKSLTFKDQTPTTGSVTITFYGGAGQGFDNLLAFVDSAGNFNGGVGPDGSIFGENTNGRQAVMGVAGIGMSETSTFAWTNAVNVDSGAVDTGLCRHTVNELAIFKTTCGTDYGFLRLETLSPGDASANIGSLSGGGFNEIWSTSDLSQRFDVIHSSGIVYAMGYDVSSSCMTFVNTVANPMMEFCNVGGNFSYSNFMPSSANSWDLGGASDRWNNVYGVTAIFANYHGTIFPDADSSYDIGVASFGRFRNIYMNGTITGCSNCGGVTSLTTTSPLIGGPITSTGNLSCPTCLTTAGGQTISASDTFSSGLTVGGNILASSGSLNIGSSSTAFNQVWNTSNFAQAFHVISAGSTIYSIGNDAGCLSFTNVAASPYMEFCNSGGNFSYSSFTPKSNLSFDLGGPSNYWNNGYINTLNVNSCPNCPGLRDPGSGGLLSRTGVNTVTPRAIVGNNPITVTNGNGVSGNPTIDCPECPILNSPNVFFSGNTFNAGITITLGTNSQIVTGSGGNFYTRPIAGSGISCSGIADGWMAVDTSGANIMVCLGGNRYKVPVVPY